MWKNRHHLPLPALKLLFNSYLERYSDLASQSESELSQHLEFLLGNLGSSSAFKVVHPLLIAGYRSPRMKFRSQPLKLIGLDIETVSTTGQPKLLGLWYPDVLHYQSIVNPTLQNLFNVVKEVTDNSDYSGFVTWGRLDIQCLIRLFDPTEKERKRIARGLSANVKKGEIIGSPPVSRKIGNALFYISHYIPGRSLKLGYLIQGRERVVWVYNLSQFWQNTIATTAKGLGLEWQDFDRTTHLIDWERFFSHSPYRKACIASNQQDAVTVAELGRILQERFHSTFDCYPSLLVSTGSLTDAAVSKMLEHDRDAYNCNSWKWLTTHVWKNQHPDIIAQTETLLAESFSAGLVDQFAVGYFPELSYADISSAYPHKIRQLPDLRYAVLLDGSGNLESDMGEARRLGYDIETAIIQGTVTVPPTLKFHPITVKTHYRENFRPVGTFKATYLFEEREFLLKYGGSVTAETYIIIALKERHLSPIAAVSLKLGELRTSILAELKKETNEERRKVLDGQQFMIKVVDNSLYGKTVMTTEVVMDVDGEPVIVGYVAGDRFNQLYGALITARTRIQLATACMEILANGGTPVMGMTDCVYWDGPVNALPDSLTKTVKTPGFFEPPSTVDLFFLLKTGQYEYWVKDVGKRCACNKTGDHWHYKLRGLNVDWDELSGTESLYHRLILDHTSTLPPYTHPQNIVIPIPTRKLVTIGSPDLEYLGLIREGITDLRPFVMSSKQKEQWILHWADTLHGHIWLDTPVVTKASQEYPLDFMSKIYLGHVNDYNATAAVEIKLKDAKKHRRMDDTKRLYLWLATQRTDKQLPPGRGYRYSWESLEQWYGIPRKDLMPNGTV